MTAYFSFKQAGESGKTCDFVFAIEDEQKAEQARAIIADPASNRRGVSGVIVPEPAWYNPAWSFHLEPRSVDFFEVAIEICDLNVEYVEKNLSDIGGALPNMFWCPWLSVLDREVFPGNGAKS